MVLGAPDLDHERVNPKIVSVHKTLRKDDRMVSPQAQAARPELGARHSGRMDHKLICLHVQGRSRLDTRYVGTMTQFCLRVASDLLEGPHFGYPLFNLLLRSEFLNRLLEHSKVQSQRGNGRHETFRHC